MKSKTAVFVLGSLSITGAVAGCGSSASDPSYPDYSSSRASLHRAQGCDGLLGDLKTDATYKINRTVNAEIAAVRACIAQYGEASCAYSAYAVEPTAVAGSERSGATQDLGAAAPTAGAGSSSASAHSDTNTQVAGVDEADIVKTDGKNLYVLHGNTFRIVRAWPATDMHELSSLALEGDPQEMFVADGRAVIYSQVNGAAIFQQAGVTPRAQYQDFGSSAGDPGSASASPSSPTSGPAPSGAYAPLTKITVLDLTGDSPRVTREVYFEGNYLTSRRVGPHVRTVFQGFAQGPELSTGFEASNQPNSPPTTGSEVIGLLDALRATNVAIVAKSQLSDWIPFTFTRGPGGTITTSTIACEDFYIPNPGSTQAGFSEVASINLDDPTSAPNETGIVGQVDTVYADETSMYLAAHAWTETPVSWGRGTAVASTEPAGPGTAGGTPADSGGSPKPQSLRTLSPPPSLVPVTLTKTHVHRFDFADPDVPAYVATGTVNGSTKDQFSMDQRDGNLRIATSESIVYVDPTNQNQSGGAAIAAPPSGSSVQSPSVINHMFVLAPRGSSLDIVGDVGPIAPNESTQSVRFVGARGYIVTSRQVDPLFAIDLVDPRAPKLLGQLTIPGFSEYMQPLDDNHLLTIGRDADANGRTKGVTLQMFDVTNGAAPVLTQRFAYGASEYGFSEAEYNHKAFTYFPDRQLLAFPYFAYGPNGARSSLELFRVDVSNGFAKIGSVDATDLVKDHAKGYGCGYYQPDVRRGIFLDTFVYSLSYGGIDVRDTANLAQTMPGLALPAPQPNPGYGPPCAE